MLLFENGEKSLSVTQPAAKQLRAVGCFLAAIKKKKEKKKKRV